MGDQKQRVSKFNAHSWSFVGVFCGGGAVCLPDPMC